MPRYTSWMARLIRATLLASAATHGVGAQEPPLSPELQAKLTGPLALGDCVAIALAQNRLLTAAGHERQAVAEGIDAALGTWWPEFGVSALRTHRRGDTEDLGSSAPGDYAEASATDLVARVAQRLRGHVEVALAAVGVQLLRGSRRHGVLLLGRPRLRGGGPAIPYSGLRAP